MHTESPATSHRTAAATARGRSARRRGRLVAVLGAVATAGALTLAPSAALAAGPTGAAFVWLDDPDASMCVVPGDRNWNSTSDFTSVNEVCSDDVGAYSVYLPGLGASAGTVQVTAYGSDAAYCKVASWAPSGAKQRVRVKCFSAAGAPADSRFTVSYANSTFVGGYSYAYVFGSQPTTASYTPPVNYQHNSTGATNTITRNQTGVYTVNAPLLAAPDGNVQVTAYGTGSEWCTYWNSGPSGTALHVQVRCFTTAGAPADSKFTMTWVRNGNMLGQSICCGPDGNPTGYLFAHNPTAVGPYTPAHRFGADVASVSHPSVGRYVVDHGAGFDAPGTVHVTAVGGGLARCKVEEWGSGDFVNVLCANAAGTPTNATFQLQYVGPFVIG